MKKIIFLVLAAVLLASGCVQESNDSNQSAPIDANAEILAHEKIDRAEYGEGRFFEIGKEPWKAQITEAFGMLPELPNDFTQKTNELRQSKDWEEFSRIAQGMGEEYYLQPEFLPNFSEIGLNYWKEPETEKWGIFGAGFFPADMEVTLKKGKEKTLVTFLHAGWYIQTWQGTRISAETQKGIEAKAEPESVLLEPTYPYVHKGWIKKIAVRIRVDEDAESGEYLAGIDLLAPESGIEEKFAEESGKAGGKYVSFSEESIISRHRLQIKIKVE